jgi:cytoskeletal protein CcmA (bactofilin family)
MSKNGNGNGNGHAYTPNGAARYEGEKPGVRSVLGPGCSVEGTLVVSGPTRLDGNVSGNLVADDFLLVDRNATVVADLNVQELVVRGSVKGNIRAKRRVSLEETARVEGDIETPAIAVSDGAQMVGKIDVARRAPLETPDHTSLDLETDAIVKKFAEARRNMLEDAPRMG